jgi:hypothetical protein
MDARKYVSATIATTVLVWATGCSPAHAGDEKKEPRRQTCQVMDAVVDVDRWKPSGAPWDDVGISAPDPALTLVAANGHRSGFICRDAFHCSGRVVSPGPGPYKVYAVDQDIRYDDFVGALNARLHTALPRRKRREK